VTNFLAREISPQNADGKSYATSFQEMTNAPEQMEKMNWKIGLNTMCN
jgi:hypothetical protein